MKRKGLLRIFGLGLALGLVGLTVTEAGGIGAPWDRCVYQCSGNGGYETWTTKYNCCSGNPSVLTCPPGETPSGYGNTWGGWDQQLQECWYEIPVGP